MPHVQLEIDFLTHPKTLATSPLAQLLFIRSLIYSATHLTDGVIPAAAIPTISYDLTQYERLHYKPSNVHASTPDIVTVDELISELVFRKRWKVFKGGYRIHDYLDYNLSRHQVLQLIDKRRKAGQAGGKASATARAKQIVNDSATIFNPTPTPTPIPITKEREKKDSSLVVTSDEVRLSRLLYDLIVEKKPDFKMPNLQQWAKHIGLMIRLDHRTPENIEAVIRWCQADQFWHVNILSTAKLREKYDQLDMKRRNTGAHDPMKAMVQAFVSRGA